MYSIKNKPTNLNNIPLNGNNMIRVKDAPFYMAVSKSTYHNFRNPKSPHFKVDFPPVIEIGCNSKAHKKADIDAWLDSKKQSSVLTEQGVQP